jgi:type IV secretion system protein VirB10
MSRLDDLADDPRPAPDDRGDRPLVAAWSTKSVPWFAIGGAVLLGLVVLGALAARRHHTAQDADPATLGSGSTVIAAPAAPADLSMVEAEGRPSNILATGPQAPVAVAPPQAPPILIASNNPGVAAGGGMEAAQRLHAPSLIVDLSAGSSQSESASAGTIQPSAGERSIGPKPGGSQLNADEQFSERIGSAQPDHASATLLTNQHSTVPQGTMIPAVLETAMNSDLPGFVRAVVSRDVRGFDGSTVLIPRGSRLVGQYRSGLSQGASRILVVWTRLIRPDGASVQLASPGGDPLGRAGQEGKVHSHFLREFTDSILLSVIGAEVTNLAAQPNTQIVIGGATTGLTSSSAPLLAQPYGTTGATTTGTTGGAAGGTAGFPPTITVRQGAPISIFVARDLDFSSVPGAAR